MIGTALEAARHGLLLGALGAALLIALVVLKLLLPAAQPMLVETCRGVQRGRFWTRFLAITLLVATPLGVVLGFVSGERFLLLLLEDSGPGDATELATMLRLGIQLEAIVIALFVLSVAATRQRFR